MKILHTFPFTMKSAMRCFFLFFILHSSFFILNAQNVAINTTGASADPSAMLDVKSTTAGVLIPRMSTSQRNAISSPAVGLQIFNTDCDVLNYWTGTCWVSAGAIPAPDSISSNVSTILCAGATATYSIPAITGATAYYWEAPPGANITSGQGTTSINVTFSSASGNVCVTANDACETSQPTCRQVSVTAPITLGAISGITSSCASAVNVAYSVPVVTGATSYTWSVPSGSSIITGQGTNAITVTFGTTSGNISVYATNSCGSNSVTQTLPITLTGSVPATPGPITGAADVCANVTSQTYSIFPVIGATSYTWSVFSGATITSGQGTTSITVIFTSSTTGTMNVSASNSCGTSVVSSSLSIRVFAAQTAPGLIGGANVVAASSTGNIYSIAAVSGGLYKWNITPSGSTITAGQGTTSITVTFPSSPGSYAICVYDSVTSNGCRSSASCLTVTSYACPVHGTAIFSYTGALQNWQVPCSVSQVTAYLWGAGGGAKTPSYSGAGGSGAFVAATLTVTPGNTLNIVVGQGAVYNTSYPSGTYGGGGSNSNGGSSYGAGGGRSAIQIQNSGTDVLTAGGGGGAGYGYATTDYGNGGGGANGSTASAINGNGTGSGSYSDGGIGGTASAGGAGGSGSCGSYNGVTGTQYQGASIGGSEYEAYGGAGGGGYYGGGSGGNCGGGGGGGGSSFPTSVPTGPVTGFISPTSGPVAGNTNTNGVNNAFIYPAEYNVSPFNSYYISGVGMSGTGNNTTSGGNGEVVILY